MFDPIFAINKANSSLVKAGPLSDTLLSGKPWVANNFLSSWMVCSILLPGVWMTSNHYEYKSTMTRYVLPEYSAKSTCIRWFIPMDGVGLLLVNVG